MSLNLVPSTGSANGLTCASIFDRDLPPTTLQYGQRDSRRRLHGHRGWCVAVLVAQVPSVSLLSSLSCLSAPTGNNHRSQLPDVPRCFKHEQPADNRLCALREIGDVVLVRTGFGVAYCVRGGGYTGLLRSTQCGRMRCYNGMTEAKSELCLRPQRLSLNISAPADNSIAVLQEEGHQGMSLPGSDGTPPPVVLCIVVFLP